MPNTLNLFRSIRGGDFAAAKQQFVNIMTAKMQTFIGREYQNVAKTMFREDKE